MDLDSIFNDEQDVHMEEADMRGAAADLQRDVLGFSSTTVGGTQMGAVQPAPGLQQVHPSMHHPAAVGMAQPQQTRGGNGAGPGGATVHAAAYQQQFVNRGATPAQGVRWTTTPGQRSATDQAAAMTAARPAPVENQPAARSAQQPVARNQGQGSSGMEVKKPISLQKIYNHMLARAQSDQQREQFASLYRTLKETGDKAQFITGMQRLVGRDNLLRQITTHLNGERTAAQGVSAGQFSARPGDPIASTQRPADNQGLQGAPAMSIQQPVPQAKPKTPPGNQMPLGFNTQPGGLTVQPPGMTAGKPMQQQVPSPNRAAAAAKGKAKALTAKQKAAVLKANENNQAAQLAQTQFQTSNPQMPGQMPPNVAHPGHHDDRFFQMPNPTTLAMQQQQQQQQQQHHQMSTNPHMSATIPGSTVGAAVPGSIHAVYAQRQQQQQQAANSQAQHPSGAIHSANMVQGLNLSNGMNKLTRPPPEELRGALAMPPVPPVDLKPLGLDTKPVTGPTGTTAGPGLAAAGAGKPAGPAATEEKPKPKPRPRKKPQPKKEPKLDENGNPVYDAEGNQVFVEPTPKPPSKAALARQKKKEKEEAEKAEKEKAAAEAWAKGPEGAANAGASSSGAATTTDASAGGAAGNTAQQKTGAQPLSLPTGAKVPAKGPTTAEQKKKEEEPQSVEDMTDVTKVSGIDLEKEQNAMLAGRTDDSEASAVRSEPEWALLSNKPLRGHVEKIRKGQGLQKVQPEVFDLLESAVQARLRALTHSLIETCHQRIDSKQSDRPVVRGSTSEVRRGVRLIEKAEKKAEDERAAAERAKLLKEAESMKRARDNKSKEGEESKDNPEDERRQKMQKAKDDEKKEKETSAANATAMGALGLTSKWAKWAAMENAPAVEAKTEAEPSTSSQAESAAAGGGSGEAVVVAIDGGTSGSAGGALTLGKERIITLHDCYTVLQKDLHTSREFLAKLHSRITTGKTIN